MGDGMLDKVCRSCGVAVDAQAKYCSQCGAPLGSARTPAETPKPRWYYTPWVVIVLLTPLVLGPLALPLLWKSPRFSRRGKVVWTILSLALMAWFTVYVLIPMYKATLNWSKQLEDVLQPW